MRPPMAIRRPSPSRSSTASPCCRSSASNGGDVGDARHRRQASGARRSAGRRRAAAAPRSSRRRRGWSRTAAAVRGSGNGPWACHTLPGSRVKAAAGRRRAGSCICPPCRHSSSRTARRRRGRGTGRSPRWRRCGRGSGVVLLISIVTWPSHSGLERRHVHDDAAAGVGRLAEADHQHVAGHAEILDRVGEREGVRRDGADRTVAGDEAVGCEVLGGRRRRCRRS